MSPKNNLPNPIQTYDSMSQFIPILQNHVPSSSACDLSSFSDQLPSLGSLWVDCKSIHQLSLVAKIIVDALHATNSKELESTAAMLQISNMATSTLIQCRSLAHDSGSKRSFKSLLIQMGMNCKVGNVLKEMILQVCLTYSLLVPYVCLFVYVSPHTFEF